MTTAVHNFKSIFRVKLSRWQAIAGLDFHVLVTLLFRGWSIVAGGATMFLLPLWLSPTEQGYYFTFGSILALQIFFELGLNQIIMQLVSHEVAHLTETVDGHLAGHESHLGRLSSLARLISRWYGVAALLFALIGGISGVVFFMNKGTQPMSEWFGIWVVLVGATAANLWISPGLAVMEGCGNVGQVARLRLVQSVLGYAILWCALLAGAGLWVTAVVPVVSVVCTSYWLKIHGHMLHWLSSRTVDLKNKLHWRTDVFPFQWRIALSWVSGYFIFNLFTPMVFSHHGAVAAGQLGMALSIFSAISTIGMSWLNAKAPNFTMHIARSERCELNVLFKALFLRSTAVITFASAGFVFVAWYLNQIGLPMMARIASPDILAVLALVTVINSMVFAMAIYMRAHREEPMLTQSVVVGFFVACSVYIGSIYGVLIMMLLYLLVCLFISLPWTIWLFMRFYRKNI